MVDEQLLDYFEEIEKDISRKDCLIRRNMPLELEGIPGNMVDIIKLFSIHSHKYRCNFRCLY
jgi:hypothetical protein